MISTTRRAGCDHAWDRCGGQRRRRRRGTTGPEMSHPGRSLVRTGAHLMTTTSTTTDTAPQVDVGSAEVPSRNVMMAPPSKGQGGRGR